MPIIELDDAKADQLMFVLANAEFKNGINWTVLNPLLMEIGRQIQLQRQPQRAPVVAPAIKLDGNAKETNKEPDHAER